MVHDFGASAFIKEAEKFSAESRRFLLSPDRWRSSRVGIAIQWTEVLFAENNADAVPRSPGIYAFVVRHENNHFPPHGFIMYVGITGAGGGNRHLQIRYRDYIREMKRNKRPKIYFMLNKYFGNLYFNYAEIDTSAVDLEKLEIDLNDALIPPVGEKDFTAEIRQLRSALQ